MKAGRIFACVTVLFTLGGLLLSCAKLEKSSGEEKTGESGAHAERGYVLQPGEGEVLRLGGPPGGQVIIKVDPVNTGSVRLMMFIQELEGRIPIHIHENEDEILFVHAGQVTGIIGDERVPVQAGATIYIPQGTWHAVENTGDGSAQLIFVISPPGLERFFREAGAPPGTELKSLTPEQFADIMRKHGMKTKPE